MEQETKLVDCRHCGHWNEDRRRAEVCKTCNNTRKTIDPETFLCNMCGEKLCHTIKTRSGLWHAEDPHGLHNVHVIGGYESYHLLDMNRYTFSLCEKCLRQMFIQFKIKPTVDEMNFDGGATEDFWEDDQKAYEYRVWKDEGGHHKAYMEKKCNSVKDCPNKAVYTILHNGNFSEDSACEEHKTTVLSSNYRLTKFISPVLRAFL